MDHPLGDREYEALAAFRRALRQFLRTAEHAARAAGITPAQHQLLLAVRGAPAGAAPTITQLAEELQLAVHSVSGLVQRAEHAGLVRVTPSPDDGRVRCVGITARGQAVLDQLFAAHAAELSESRRALLASLTTLEGDG